MADSRWSNPAGGAANDAGLDGKRFTYDPAGAAVKDLRRRFGSQPQSTYASDIYAQLTRQQYADVVRYINPIQDELIDYATSANTVPEAVEQARTLVNGSFARQQGAQQRRLRGLGMTLTPEEQAASTRSTGLARGLAEVNAINTTRDQVRARQASLLGNPAPSIVAPQGV